MRIAFIGSGNVAAHLSRAFNSAGHSIVAVLSRKTENAKKLADQFEGCVFGNLNDVHNYVVDVVFLAVTDSVVKEVIASLDLQVNTIVAHCSGSLNLQVFHNSSFNYGVFYPLQTFSQNIKVDILETPIFVEAKNVSTQNALMTLGGTISNTVLLMNSERREKVHLAAVFCNNFVNLMFRISGELVKKESLDFDLLRPLISATFSKIINAHPADIQTGPASRNDYNTLERHLELLSSVPETKAIYKLLSEEIIRKQSQK